MVGVKAEPEDAPKTAAPLISAVRPLPTPARNSNKETQKEMTKAEPSEGDLTTASSTNEDLAKPKYAKKAPTRQELHYLCFRSCRSDVATNHYVPGV